VVTVSACVPSSPVARCVPGQPKSPAAKAGIRSGDAIVAVAGQRVHSYSALVSVVRKKPPGVPLTLTVRRDGTLHDVRVVLARPSWDAAKKISFLGVSQTQIYSRAGPIAALGQAGNRFGSIVTQSFRGLAKIPCAFPVLFSPHRGTSACGKISSVIGAANVTGQVVAQGYSWQETAGAIFTIVISVNIFVGIFNLLPLLPLDGGHIAIVAYERARAAVARWRRRSDPGLVDISKLIPVSVGVFAVLIGLSLLLIAADIFNPLNLSQ